MLEKVSTITVTLAVISFILYKGGVIKPEIAVFIAAWAVRIFILELLIAGVSYVRKMHKRFFNRESTEMQK